MANGYLYVKGNVNIFCPHCGNGLWQEIPHGQKCLSCGGAIDLESKKRKEVSIEYVKNLAKNNNAF